MKELQMIIGCGGLCYYALPTLSLETHMRGAEATILIFFDHDKIESGNASRQWSGMCEGSSKAVAASSAFGAFHASLTSYGHEGKWTAGQADEYCLQDQPERIVVVCLPDNPHARLESLNWAASMALEEEVMWFTAGNDLSGGFATGWWANPNNPINERVTELKREYTEKVMEEGDTLPDIVRCSQMVEQSAMSNRDTVSALGTVMATIRNKHERFTERYWAEDEHNRIVHWGGVR